MGSDDEVRVLVQGVTKDAEAFSAFMKSEAEALEEVEPGTLLMEVFLDPASGAVVVQNATRMLMLSSRGRPNGS